MKMVNLCDLTGLILANVHLSGSVLSIYVVLLEWQKGPTPVSAKPFCGSYVCG